jgi:hypothetical protein
VSRVAREYRARHDDSWDIRRIGGGTIMRDSSSTPWRPDAFARKWHALAERRRNHLAELYETGAWKRYFTEETLRMHMRDAVREAEHWGSMIDESAPAATERPQAPSAASRAA